MGLRRPVDAVLRVSWIERDRFAPSRNSAQPNPKYPMNSIGSRGLRRIASAKCDNLVAEMEGIRSATGALPPPGDREK